MNFEQELKKRIESAEAIIKEYLPEEAGFAKKLAEAMNYSMLAGGKRLRPVFMREVYEMFGGKGEEIRPFMAAMEMIHTHSLIHDDLPDLDNDKYRRGKETTHVVFGVPAAILAGDALLNYAYETAFRAFDLPQVEPLFHPSDVIFFDQYADGDAYTEETYGANFRCILKAIKEKQLLEINYSTGKGRFVQGVVLPVRLEYSEKDDKFRLSALEKDRACTINLGRILHCEPYEGSMDSEFVFRKPEQRSFTFEVTEERNTLERALLHFAHFQKRAEKVGEQKYSVTIFYEKEDETELVIRVLAFGPMIRVTGPDSFLACIRQRLKNQKSCEH